MRVSLPYGRGTLQVELPGDAEVLVAQAASPLPDVQAALAAALASPVSSPPLGELARGRGSACLVISDGTRPAVGPHVLPLVSEVLERAGVATLSIVIATGTHRAATLGETLALAGRDMARRYTVRSHDGLHGEHDYVGQTASGVPGWIDRGYTRARLRIVIGVVEPHLMAGYSGGAKSVCPGLARLDTVRGLHRETLSGGRVGPGIVQGNPFRAEIAAATRLVGVDFSIQLCVTRGSIPAFVSAGDLDATTAASVAFAAAHPRVATASAADVVLTTAGGAPLDSTLYQAAKGWAAGASLVRHGGHLVLAAELSDGIGSEDFEKLLTAAAGSTRPAAPLRETPAPPAPSIGEGGDPGGGVGEWMVQHISQLRSRARLHLVSSLPPERLEALGFEAHRTVEEALRVLSPAGAERRLLVLPRGCTALRRSETGS